MECKYERVWRDEKRPRLAAATRAAQPIIAALAQYHRDHERYPEELEALVPQHLGAIPDPRPPLHDPWVYVPLDGGDDFLLYAEAPMNYYGVPIQPPSTAEQLVYESDGTYEHDPWSVEAGEPRQREPIDRIGKWAYYAYHDDLF
ncbi:MAG: hypothetical protein U9R79_01335 [Armatimonadota bacterium]|nr:hypothetical protein [Armatimonadota bacterium]